MPADTTKHELGAFLKSRRARLTPELVGLDSYGVRRVPGLRREELAQLAGISPTYYMRLEQGHSVNASDAVIESLAHALELDADERVHLFDLARPRATRRRRTTRPERVNPSLTNLLAAMDKTPAAVVGRRTDVLAWNTLGHSLLASHLPSDLPDRARDRPNLTRMLFLDSHTRELYRDWHQEACRAVASLRVVAARFKDDPLVADLIGELTMNSDAFATIWARHPVKQCVSGVKRFQHPTVGRINLRYDVLDVGSDGGQRLIAYHPDAGSSDAAALELLNRQTQREGHAVPTR